MKASENRIREIAYQIWESEGYPHGQADRHWELATKLVSVVEYSNAVPDGVKSSETEKDSSTKPFMKLVKSIESSTKISAETNSETEPQITQEEHLRSEKMQKEKRQQSNSRKTLSNLKNDMESSNSSKQSTTTAKKTFKEKLKSEDTLLVDLKSDELNSSVGSAPKRKVPVKQRVTEIE